MRIADNILVALALMIAEVALKKRVLGGFAVERVVLLGTEIG